MFPSLNARSNCSASSCRFLRYKTFCCPFPTSPCCPSPQIYGYVSRHFDSSNYKGKWTDEEKESLTRLVGERGERWKEIGILIDLFVVAHGHTFFRLLAKTLSPHRFRCPGAAMGRPGYACRDKWRMMRNNPNKGDWSEHEVTLLKVRASACLSKCKVFVGGQY